MFEMIMFGVVLGITLILSNLITMGIVLKVSMSDKFLDWYAGKIMTASTKLMNGMVSQETEEDKKIQDIKNEIFKDVHNYTEED